MNETTTRVAGLATTAAYAAFIVWIYVRQPQTLAQVTGGLTDAVGAYRINQQAFADGLRFFRKDQFPEARMSFAAADPADRDATTQFYIAYAFYREGWGRLYHDDRLYGEGLAAVDRAMADAPAGRLVVDDPNLLLHTPQELKTELEAGTHVAASDFNPMRVFEKRK